MVLFIRNVKKMKGTVHKNGNVHRMCKRVFKITMHPHLLSLSLLRLVVLLLLPEVFFQLC